MATQYLVEVSDLDVSIREIQASDARRRVAASRALNRAADSVRTSSARQILDEIALPKNYLAPSSGRFSVSQRANPDGLEAKITARFRPTSLARFVRGTPRRGEPVAVEVKPGSTQRIPRAFLIPLKAGSADLDTKANMGLAVRTRGGALRASRAAKRLAPGLYLLYGPSVSQAFGQIADVKGRDASEIFTEEFFRQLDL